MATEHIMGERGKHCLITEVIQVVIFTHRLLLRCWCSSWPLEGRSDPQVCEWNWIKRYKNGKRKIDGKATKLRIFCCYTLTGSKFNTFKWSSTFQWPWMTFNVWLSGDQLNCKKKRAAWVFIFPLLSHLKIPSFTHFHGWLLIRDVCLRSLWLLENWACLFNRMSLNV